MVAVACCSDSTTTEAALPDTPIAGWQGESGITSGAANALRELGGEFAAAAAWSPRPGGSPRNPARPESSFIRWAVAHGRSEAEDLGDGYDGEGEGNCRAARP